MLEMKFMTLESLVHHVTMQAKGGKINETRNHKNFNVFCS